MSCREGQTKEIFLDYFSLEGLAQFFIGPSTNKDISDLIFLLEEPAHLTVIRGKTFDYLIGGTLFPSQK